MMILFGSMMRFGEGYDGNYMMGQGYFGLFGTMWVMTWILVIVALVAFIRWMWKKGDKVK